MAEQPNCVSGGSESLLDTAGAAITRNTARYKTKLSGSRKRENPSDHRTPSRKRSRKDSRSADATKEIFEENTSISDLHTNQKIYKDSVSTESINWNTLDRSKSPPVSRDKSGNSNHFNTATRTRGRVRGRGRSTTIHNNNSNFDIAAPAQSGRGGKFAVRSHKLNSTPSDSNTVSTRSRAALAGRKTNTTNSTDQPRGISKIDNGVSATPSSGGRGGGGGGPNNRTSVFSGHL